MHIPHIKGAQVRGALHHLKSACVEKEQAAKKMLPGLILCAQSFALPVQAPGVARIIRPNAQMEKDVFVNAGSKFKQIKGMIAKTLPDVSDEFVQGILETAKTVKCEPEDLTALLFKESQFKPNAKNGNFVGIGQMNRNSLRLSIRHAAVDKNAKKGIQDIVLEGFRRLPREQQIPYVRNYILAAKKSYIKNMDKHLSGGELYGLFYTPARVNKKFLAGANDPETSSMYYSNKSLDYDKDSIITKKDLQKILDDVKTYDLNVRLAKK